MRCFISNSTVPNFNLATEEYFLKNSSEEYFILYINNPCVIVGKHQNLLSEINLQYLQENNIQLSRRISGGGAVYHDNNNLNFSFIHNCKNREEINYRTYTLPIQQALNEMGIQAEFSERNDLLLNTKKISGNAMHIFKTRVLSHGTILFNSDLMKLSSSLKNNSVKYIDKSVKSVRSQVTNIFDQFNIPITLEEFTQKIFQKIVSKNPVSRLEPLNSTEEKLILKTSIDKYETWEWTLGYSPKYLFTNKFRVLDIIIEIELFVERGIINTVNITTNNSDLIPIFKELTNGKHDYNTIKIKLESNPTINSMTKINISELCYELF